MQLPDVRRSAKLDNSLGAVWCRLQYCSRRCASWLLYNLLTQSFTFTLRCTVVFSDP